MYGFSNKVYFKLNRRPISPILSKSYNASGEAVSNLASLVHSFIYPNRGMGKESVILKKRLAVLGLLVAFIWTVLPEYGVGATVSTRSLTSGKSKSAKVSEGPRARKRLSKLSRSRGRTVRTARARRRRSRRHYERFTANSFANDSTDGDVTEGEDPIVRQAAIDALGNMNGTVLAIEPTSGRMLTMVNQKLALSSGAQPCSTIKLSVALAALSEDLITKDTQIALGAPQPDEPDDRSGPFQQRLL